MEEVLGRLVRVLEELGTDVSDAMQPAGSLEELEGELTPFQLPTDLRVLWQHCDPSRLPIAFFPFETPSSALHSWRLARAGGVPPAALLQLSYLSNLTNCGSTSQPIVTGGDPFSTGASRGSRLR